MRYVDAGGVRLSAIGLGTWQFGSREWGYGRDYAEGEAGRLVTRALDLRVNLVDTAEAYGFGQSERIVGRALAGRRQEAFVATKLFPLVPVAPVVANRARASARRLGVDRLDLYQVHWPNPMFPPAPLMHELGHLQAEGLVRHVGVSNFSLAQWQQAERDLGGPVLSNQVQFSLARRPPDELLAWARQHDRVVIAYSPLAQGFLSGRYHAGHLPGGVRATNPLFTPDNLQRGAGLLAAVGEIAAAHGATPAQVALAWVLRRPNVVVIPGASSVAQLEANVAAADLALSEDEDRRLTEESDRFQPVVGPAAIPAMLRARLPF